MIEITQQAKFKLQEKLNQQTESVGIKVGVRKSGCSGYAYVMEYIAEDGLDNLVKHEIDGVEVYIDPKHNVFLEGMTIDFQKKGLNELFEFINPNESARCGCGESFTL